MTNESTCIFCKIIAGQIPAAKLFEDEAALAFMDVGPVSQGHALLVPKKHCECIWDLPADIAAAVLRHLPALVGAVRAATGCEGINVLQNNGKIAGQLVPHVHFHIIPRDRDGAFSYTWPAGKYPAGRMEELAEEIRSHL